MRLIVAVDSRWGIGKNGDLLTSIPDDMQYYRSTTRGKAVVMGYTTLLSLPGSKPAPGRLNLVLADIKGLKVCGAVVCGSLDQLLAMIGNFEPDDIFDIGGGSMYRQLLPYCEKAHITKMRFDGGADTFIPDLDALAGWSVESESELREHEGIGYSFAVYRNSDVKPVPAAARKSSSMAAYFRKKEPGVFDYPVDADERYRAEFIRLLHAYYRPLEKGFGADDVAEFLSDDSGVSFEDYLRGRGLIAACEDIEAFAARSAAANRPICRICVPKERLDDFEQAASLDAFLI